MTEKKPTTPAKKPVPTPGPDPTPEPANPMVQVPISVINEPIVPPRTIIFTKKPRKGSRLLGRARKKE